MPKEKKSLLSSSQEVCDYGGCELVQIRRKKIKGPVVVTNNVVGKDPRKILERSKVLEEEIEKRLSERERRFCQPS